MDIDIRGIFERAFGCSPACAFFAPGRVNLIGEHTDYNGGHVFPCAIDKGTYCAVRMREDSAVRLYSENFSEDGVISSELSELDMTGTWADYPIAVMRAMARFGYELPFGADIAFCGDLPGGAGLSSSAALEVLTATALGSVFGMHITRQVAALIGQFAENRFIGVSCGIMDQFASAMGLRDNAILLDSNTLEYTYAPLPRGEVSIVIINTGVKHSLAFSAYNERRRQCETALAQLRDVTDAPSLCSLTPEELERHIGAVTDPICRKRARHAVLENARTVRAARALQEGDLREFGRLMNESHDSLSKEYEVSCEELDFLAYTAQKLDGVLGARMTGGGFGGCTVDLIERGKVSVAVEKITRLYREKFGISAEVYEINAEDGAREVD